MSSMARANITPPNRRLLSGFYFTGFSSSFPRNVLHFSSNLLRHFLEHLLLSVRSGHFCIGFIFRLRFFCNQVGKVYFIFAKMLDLNLQVPIPFYSPFRSINLESGSLALSHQKLNVKNITSSNFS